jgi:hypothetical protein
VANGIIIIKRETSVQDAIRSYAIFIDGKRQGRIWASKTRRFEVSEGKFRSSADHDGIGVEQ